ncbi:MAG: hypothetical protein ACFB4J_19260 [Elainellaceae cyanobacterium]
MLNYRRVLAAAAGLLIPLTLGTSALAQTVSTPIQNYQVSGTSGGSRQSSCGFIDEPALRVQVNEPLASLRFRASGGGALTLLVTNGQSQDCVMSDGLSGGAVELPGVWERGTYSVFVGDRNGNSHQYQLSVTQE